MKKRMLAMFLTFMMLLALVGCGQKDDVPQEPTEPTDVEEQDGQPTEPPTESEEPAARNPLTGLPMEEAYLGLRPVAVMFNNIKVSMPQLGVAQADIIYEIPAEGGITRMLGIYQTLDGVGNLGSIRSTRTYYIEAALGHDALLVHAGGSPDAYKKISSWGVDNMDGVNGGSDAAIFWRDAERKKSAGYEHSLLTSGEKVQEYIDKGHFRTEHEEDYNYTQTFVEDGTPVSGTSAKRVEVAFSNYKTGVFLYDAKTKQYKISQYGKAYSDGNSGEQVSATNILVLETDINIIPGDEAGRLEVEMTGSGKGTYICGGKSIPITWTKQNRTSPFIYETADGQSLALGCGTSYICIIDPATSKLTIV